MTAQNSGSQDAGSAGGVSYLICSSSAVRFAGAGASALAGQGYRHAAMSDLTPRMLRNSDVYGMDGERIGAIRSVVETDSGIITGIVVDIGGLLGMGGRAVALPMRDLTVLRQADGDRLRVRVNVTKAQLQAMPRHRN